jgi:PKD repeat protein/photosystem II stability/assembly factor-like uncharacterized protein
MKQIYPFLLFILLTFSAIGQPDGNVEPTDTANYPHWIEMMQNQNINFYQTQRAFNLYWQSRTPVRGDGYKPYKRWENFWQTRVSVGGEFPSPEQNLQAYQDFYGGLNQNPLMSPSGSWTELGPIALPTNGTGQPNGLGRVNCVAFHPTNANIIFIGAPSGGLWKTTDGGNSWVGLTDNLPSLGVSSIIINPTNPDIIYLGTGDRDAGDAPGIGVYKSTNGGASWSVSNTGMGSKTVNMMIIHPTNSNIIIAATSGGIYKTIDAGSSWTLVSSNTSNYKDIAFKPGDPTTVYSTITNAFYKSINNGDSWTQITSGLPTSGRFVIGVSAANSAYVYLAVGTSSGFTGIYRSTNNGASFTTMSTSPNILGYEADGSDNESQAFYDLCIAVDPTNINTLYVGGINIWKSINGGATWAINAHWVGTSAPAVHADQHWLSFSPLNNKLYNGNDGGLYYTTNGGSSWIDISSGLPIAQIYKIGQSAKSKNLVINGYQDNGTAIFKNGTWATEIGGDGMECLIDPNDTNFIYGALYYGDIRRSNNNGLSFSQIADNGLNGINESGAWVTPYTLKSNDPNTMFIGYKNVWRSSNVKTASTSSIVWTKISTFGTTTNLSDIESSIADPNILYVSRGTSLFRSDNANAVSPTWTTLSAPATITDLEAHPSNSNIIYITAGTNIYKSTNKGLSWTSIKSNLPTTSMNTLVYDTTSNEGIYVGTDIGVFYKDATMTNWVPYSTGLPVSAEITELEIFYGTGANSSVIRAGTYGRGMWSSDLYISPLAAPLADFSASTTSPCQGQYVVFTDMSTGTPTSYSWTFSPNTVSFVSSTTATSKNPTVIFLNPGNYSVSLTATNANGFDTELKSNYISVGTPYTAPASENFESFTTGNPGTFVNGWSFSNTGTFNWRVNNGPTASAYTGPNFDHSTGSSSGKYLYTEASSPAVAGEIANLISPCIWIPASSNYQLSFWYHMYGLTITGLHVDVFHNGNWINDIYTINGQQQTSNASSWLQATTSLSSYAGSTIQIRLRVVCGSTYEGDVAVDDISIGLPGLPVANFSASTTSTYTGTTVLFADASLNTPTSWAWSFSPSTVSYVSSTNANSQNPQVTFNSTGNYTVTLIAANSNGSDTLIKSNYITVSSGTALPFTENFQTFTVGTPGSLNNGWSSSNSGNFLWTVNSGLTPSGVSGLTGPLNDHTLGTTSGKYLFTEASPAAAGSEAQLITPTLNLTGIANAELKFWYHMFGAGVTALNIEVYTTTWTTIHTITGQQQLNQTDPWIQASVNLQAYVGSNIKIRFRVLANGDYRNDIAIDDVIVQQVTAPANDNTCGATSLTVGSSCNYSTFNNNNSTTTLYANPPCGGTATNDVWFKFIAPASGMAIIDAEPTLTGGFADGAMAAYKGNCLNLIYLDCNDDYNGSGNMPYLSLSNLTPGDTIFIRFWKYGGGTTGSFQLCVYEPPFIIIDPTAKNVSSALGSTTYQIISNQSWMASDNVSWAVVSPTTGTGNATLTVSYSANSGVPRTAAITVTNGAGITKNATMTQYSSVIADFTTSNPYLCKNSQTTFTNSSVNQTSNQWFVDGISVATTTNLNYTFTTSGTHIVKLKVVNTQNSDSISKVVYVSNPPISNAGADTALCTGGTINLVGSVSTGIQSCNSSCNIPTYCASQGLNDDFEYINKVEINGSTNESGNEGVGYQDFSNSLFTVLNIDSTRNLSVTGFITSGTYLEYVEAFIDWNRNGLFDEPSISLGSATFTGAHLFTGIVTVPSTAVLGKTKMRIILKFSAAVISGCELNYSYGETEDYMIEIVGIGQTSYSWTGPSSFSSLSRTASINPASVTNSGNYTLSVADGFGCTHNDIKSVTINPIPNVGFSSINSLCINSSSITLNQGSPSGGTYWGPGVSGNIFNPATAGIGTHTLFYSYINASGCGDTASQTVTVNALPIVSFAAVPSACINGASIQLNTGLPAGGTYSGSGVSNGVFYPIVAGLGSKTLTYSFTNSNGCSNSAQSTIAVNAAPTVSVTNQGNKCLNGGTIALSGGLPVGGTYFGSGITNGMFNPTTTGLGNFYVNYTYSNSYGCSDTAIASIAVVAPPTANLSNLPSVCANSSLITLTGGTPIGGTYIGSGVSNGQFNPSIGAGLYPIGYIVTNSNNCSDTAINSITVNALPIVNIVGLPSSTCNNNGIINLVGSPTGGQFSGPGVLNNQLNPITAGNGNKQITYTYTDLNSCTKAISQIINILAAPTVNAGSDDTINYSTAASLTGTVGGGGNITYLWKPTNKVINANSLNTLTTSMTTSQLFTLVATKNGTGCHDSDYVMITVIGGPLSLNISTSTNQVCIGDSVQLQAYAGGGSGNYTYNWTFGGVSIANQSSTQIAPNASGFYKISLTDGISTKLDSIYITVNPLPNVFLGGLQSVCQGSALFTLYGGVPTGGIYSGVGVTNNQFNSNISGPGNHQISYAYSDSNNCISSASTSLVVNSKPNASQSNFNTVCETAPSFTLSGGLPIGGTYSGVGVSSNVFSPLTAGVGSFNISYIFIDQNNCADTAIKTLSVQSSPVANAGIDKYVAINNQTTLNGSATGGSGNYGWYWNPTSKLINPSVQVPQTTILNSTTTFTLIVNDLNTNCSDSDNIVVFITGGQLVNSISSTTNSLCLGDSVKLTSLASGGLGNYTYNWSSIPSGFTSNIYDPIVKPIVPTKYFITISDGQYQITDSIMINVSPIPIVNLGNDSLICGGGTVVLNAGSGGNSYLWSNNSTNQYQTINFSMLQPGIYSYSVKVINAGNCSASDSIIFVKDNKPYVNLGYNDSICYLSSIVLDAGYGFYNYLWSTGDTNQIIMINGSNIGLGNHGIWVEVSSKYGCTNADTMILSVENCQSISEIGNNYGIKIYPNPNNGIFNLKFSNFNDKEVLVELINLQGEIIMKQQFKTSASEFEQTIDLSTHSKGVYLIRLSNQKLLRIERVIIQ